MCDKSNKIAARITALVRESKYHTGGIIKGPVRFAGDPDGREAIIPLTPEMKRRIRGPHFPSHILGYPIGTMFIPEMSRRVVRWLTDAVS